jgi:NADH-quinone oxidoreductase subunit M
VEFDFATQLGFRGLTILTFLPVVGALVMLVFMRKRPSAYKATALITTIITLVLAIYLATQFQTGTAEYQFQENVSWIASLGISYHLGVDGISLLLILLTTLLSVVAIAGSWNSIKDRGLAFFISLLVLETGMLGVFVSMDLFLFYVFWEVQLIPMYFIIGLWGGVRRVYAAIKFFLFTFAGSVLMLVAILAVVWRYSSDVQMGPTFDILTLQQHGFSGSLAAWSFAAFFIAFAIKVPMFPVHTWLPDAHTEAPTAGSVILAGVLLKMGVYGMIRFCIGFFPEMAVKAITPVLILSVVAVVYGAAMSLIQPDMKRLVAYSSVSHMGFVTAGLFVFNQQGIEGSVLQMVSHGILTGALFMMVGFFYDRTHTRLIADYGGMAKPMPVAAAFFSLFVLGSLGLPGLSGFVGEFLILVGVFQYAQVFAVLASIGIVLGAAYLLWMYQRTMFQPANEKWLSLKDLSAREIITLVPLVGMAVWIGIYPHTFLNFLHEPALNIMTQVQPYLAEHSNGLLKLASALFGGGF